MNHINNILGILIESIYESLTLYFVFIVCMLNFFCGRLLNIFLPVTIIYILVLKIFFFRTKMHQQAKAIFFFIIFMISGILSYTLLYGEDIVFILLGSVYFTGCGFYAWIKSEKESYLPEELKKLLIILFLSGFITMYLRNGEYLEAINSTATFYCIFSLIYLVRMNLIREYKVSSVEVNSHSNIVFVNLLSLFIALIFIFLQKNIVTWLPYLFLGAMMGLIELLKHIWTVINWGLQAILSISLKIHPTGYTKDGEEALKSSVEELILEEESLPTDLENIQGAVEHYEGIKILVVILILCCFAGMAYLSYRKIKTVLNENVGDFEEKTFVFSKEEWKDSMKKKINKLLGRDLLDPIRKKYLKTVNGLIHKGYEMEKGMTPNEYLKFVSMQNQKLSKEHGLDELTEEYNITRYKKGN